MKFLCVPVAQLDRAHGYEPWGQEFESLRARYKQSVALKHFRRTRKRRRFCFSIILHGKNIPASFEQKQANSFAPPVVQKQSQNFDSVLSDLNSTRFMIA